MPSKSKKQRRFMAAAANNPEFARKAGIKQSVAREFHEADKKRTKRYATGGLASLYYNASNRPSVARQGGVSGGNPRGPLGEVAQRARRAIVAGRNAPQPAARGPLPAQKGGLPPTLYRPSSGVGIGQPGPIRAGERGGLASLGRERIMGRYARGGPVTKTVRGTNCANCIYYEKPSKVTRALNPQGGLVIKREDLDRAEEADLITLPGSGKPQSQGFCKHSEVKQDVNDRMCCAYWDAPGTYRQWDD